MRDTFEPIMTTVRLVHNDEFRGPGGPGHPAEKGVERTGPHDLVGLPIGAQLLRPPFASARAVRGSSGQECLGYRARRSLRTWK